MSLVYKQQNPWAKQCGIESQYSSISILSITPEFLVFLHWLASVLHTADEINNKLALHPYNKGIPNCLLY